LGKWKKKTLTWHDEQDVPVVFSGLVLHESMREQQQ
jgi:hypothetical protein